ncbi:MAG: twin transmembrane helix small protein [Alphaproteobacteria bacterium]|nr:MAG: twin transmembrane helix small protein [Alphaproteobacteria bacterium]
MGLVNILIPIALGVVLIILIAGVITMAKGGETSRKYSNKLMQARVLAQFVAIILIAILLVFAGK